MIYAWDYNNVSHFVSQVVCRGEGMSRRFGTNDGKGFGTAAGDALGDRGLGAGCTHSGGGTDVSYQSADGSGNGAGTEEEDDWDPRSDIRRSDDPPTILAERPLQIRRSRLWSGDWIRLCGGPTQRSLVVVKAPQGRVWRW